ncbi:MAG: hypothetical protein ABIY90_00100 [Puia sp.]
MSPTLNSKILLLTILSLVLLLTLYTPFQLINSDSVHGFEAMNGYYWTGKFNTFLFFNPDTQQLQERFLTWWSPGQYLAPLFFIKLFHLKIGTAVTLVNFLGTLLGTLGYFLVFRRYHFDSRTIWVSLLLILFSSSILQRYYLYDGGESLNFMVFPWIFVIQKWFVNRYGKWILPILVIFVSFICKLQMLIVVPLLIFLLIAANSEELNYFFIWNKPFRKLEFKQSVSIYLPYIISGSLVCLLIYFGFIHRGATPADAMKHFSLNPVNFLFPIASPVTSVYFFDSVNAWLNSRPFLQNIYLLILSGGVLAAFIYFIKHFPENDFVKRKYNSIVLMLYLLSVLVFVVLYCEGSSIDFNTRHFKLTSFLFYPILVEQAWRKLDKRVLIGLFAFLSIYAIGNHIRLSRIWISNTSVTASRFRLTNTDLPIALKEKLDRQVRTKTAVISWYSSTYCIDNPMILPILGADGDSSKLARAGYRVVVLKSLNTGDVNQ